MFNLVSRTSLVPLMLLVAAGHAHSASGQPPLPEPPPPAPAENIHGSVTLPYAELRSLWLAAQPAQPRPTPPPLPPVTYALRSARYSLAFTTDPRESIGEADFDVQTFGEGWTAVPLLGSASANLQAIEPEGTLVTVRDGYYTLLTDKPGSHPAKLRFSTPLAAHDSADGKRRLDLRLQTSPAVINELALSKVPAGWVAEVAGSTPAAVVSAAPPGESAPQRYHLAPDAAVVLTLARAEDKHPAPAPVQSVWRGEAQSVVRYDDGRLAYETHLRITTEAGAGLTAVFVLPVSVNVLSVSGEDLQGWHVARVGGEAGGGSAVRRLELTWKTPDVLRREIVLNYERSQLLPAGDWPLVSPGLAEGQGRLESALYVLAAVDGLEFTAGDASVTLAAGNARQIPRWLAVAVGSESFVACSVANAAPAGSETGFVHARQLPLVQTVKATVEEGNFETRLVADGALLNKGTWQVRHDAPLTFAIALPPRAQVLTCLADGHDIAAVDRGSGHIEIMLPNNAAGKPTAVTLSYTDKQPPLAPVSGQVTLTLPQTPLFVKTLHWDLEIPADYELLALEGNVGQTSQPEKSRTGDNPANIHLSKDLLNGEQPSIELFYQKRSVNP